MQYRGNWFILIETSACSMRVYFLKLKLRRQNQRRNARLGREWKKLSLYCGKNSKPYFVYIDTEKQGLRSGRSISTIVMIFQHPNILPQMIPSATKWWNYILRWPLLGSEITPHPDSPCDRAFQMLETVCGNHCSMGWPWDGRYRIISSTTMRWDGCSPKLSWCPSALPPLLETPPTTGCLALGSDLSSCLPAQYGCGPQHNQWAAAATLLKLCFSIACYCWYVRLVFVLASDNTDN